MTDVRLVQLTRSFDSRASAGLFDVSLSVASGELLTVVGPSGAGKSTLLRLVAGLDRPDSGRVELGGRDVTPLPPHERDVGMVFQRAAIYPHLDVRRNLSIGLEMSQSRRRTERVSSEEIRRRVNESIEILDLGLVLDRRSDQLSGGEQQRVALGRLLVRRPSVWLLDEPWSHLDVGRKNEFRRHLHLLRERFPATIIVVTHDPVEALTLGQRLAVLDSGRLQQVDSPLSIYAKPANRFVAGMVGWPPLNLTEGALVRETLDEGFRFAAADGSLHLPMPAELVTHGVEGLPVAVGIRPEDVALTYTDFPLITLTHVTLANWRIVRMEYLPPRWLVEIERGRQHWRIWSSDRPHETTVNLLVDVSKLHWFDQRGMRIDPKPV